jgi:glucuronokinase
MVMTARSAGASAKFAGSGGAIVGTYEDDAQFARLSKALADIGCQTIKPTIA